MILDALIAAGGCLVGFTVGIALTARRIPHTLARATPDELRALAQATSRLRDS